MRASRTDISHFILNVKTFCKMLLFTADCLCKSMKMHLYRIDEFHRPIYLNSKNIQRKHAPLRLFAKVQSGSDIWDFTKHIAPARSLTVHEGSV